MMTLFKPTPYYIRIYKNKIEVKNLKTGQSITRVSAKEFSSNRLLLADFEVAEQFFRTVISEFSGSKLFTRSLKVAMQPMELIEGGLSPTEKRAFRDSAEHIGAIKMIIINHTNYLSDKEFEEAFLNPELF